MRWIGTLIVFSLFVAVTGGAFFASTRGVGLPGLLDKPVSVRQQSVSGRRHTHAGPMFLYFGSGRSRRFGGGGYGYGK